MRVLTSIIILLIKETYIIMVHAERGGWGEPEPGTVNAVSGVWRRGHGRNGRQNVKETAARAMRVVPAILYPFDFR